MAKQVKAISPQEILANLDAIIPSFVLQAVNTLLIKNFRGDSVSIKVDEIIAEACVIRGGLVSRQDFFENKWLDFETIYINQGWDVVYNKPDRDENFKPYYTFTPKK